jgi:hypothetical protein
MRPHLKRHTRTLPLIQRLQHNLPKAQSNIPPPSPENSTYASTTPHLTSPGSHLSHDSLSSPARSGSHKSSNSSSPTSQSKSEFQIRLLSLPENLFTKSPFYGLDVIIAGGEGVVRAEDSDVGLHCFLHGTTELGGWNVARGCKYSL